ncbi:MAG TPA: NAD(P)/FAD-dependent oxidoreductase [Planktothrix sp.]|jgi:NADH dehydrogenase
MEKSRPRVVIIGGGFGGIKAAQGLAKAPVDITIIDRHNYHLFQPLLYQVAMAGLSPSEISYPIRAILRHQANATVLLDEVQSIDTEHRSIKLLDSVLEYDYLIVATGSQTSYFGHDAWKTHAVGLKDIDDATALRSRILLAFEAAEREPDKSKRHRLLTFVIIGGGPTGVELAGSLAELSRSVLAADFRNIDPTSAHIILLDGGARILSAYEEKSSEKAKAQLEKMGVEVRNGARVTDITAEGVQLGEELLPSACVIWCGGVSGVGLTKSLGVQLDKGGRVPVSTDLSLDGHKEVFVIGDAAVFLHQDGKPLPGLAPVAVQQGEFAAEMIRADLKRQPRGKFVYSHRGTLATIGRKSAVAEFSKLKLYGFTAWLAWLFIHVMFLIGFRNKAIVMFNWAWSYFTFQRGARLITGNRISTGTFKT